ncbi:MAG TPA: calcium/sodium antiporter [Gemmatimonadaceae bacterium]|nr:calcium/sodium antiporter [Gemmatimonadaceae bacterium]
MSAVVAVGLVVLGLVLLAGGGEALVRAASTLAELAGVTPAVIGLTVVAIGTSLPELVVSLMATLQGQSDLAVANVVGSNIFNVAAALGLTALIVPLPVHGAAVRLEWPFMFVASVVCLLLSRDGTLDRLEGGFFVISLALFIAYTVRLARREVGAAEAGELAAEVESRDIDAPGAERRPPGVLLPLVVLAIGIGALVVGGRLLVDGAVTLARLAGLSERVIGLTIVAGGTGAPELATSIVAAIRKRTDVAVANMIGSNIVNILGILGIAALASPIRVSPEIVRTDMWWMIGTAVLLLPLLRSGLRVTRVEGLLLTAAYGVYIGTLLGT